MTRIAVPLEEMQQLAGVWQHTITEMDAMIQQVAREISAIPDKAKGLNDVRSQGQKVGAQHREFTARGMDVHKHVIDSVQRFMQTEQELTRMVSHPPTTDLSRLFIQAGGGLTLGGLTAVGNWNSFFGDGGSLIESLIQFGDKVNYVNELGLALQVSTKYPELARRFTEFTSKLNLWPTLSKVESSEKLAGKLGYVLLGLSLAKDGMDAYSAYQQNDVQRGRTEIANMVATAGFATTTALANAVVPGSGLVLVGVQLGSDALAYSADKLRANGYQLTADVVQFFSNEIDIQGKMHEKAMYFFRLKDAYEAGGTKEVITTAVNDKIKEVTDNVTRFGDFVNRSSNQVAEEASKLYQGAKNSVSNWIFG